MVLTRPIPGSDAKAQVLNAFQALLAQRQTQPSKVATRQEEADKAVDRQIVETVTQYSPEGLVRELTDLQGTVGDTVVELTTQLSDEIQKLQDLQRSIAVEQQRRQNLQQVRIVADALYLLNQEHQENLSFLEQRIAQSQEKLAQEQQSTRKGWDQEQVAFEQRSAEAATLRDQERQRQEADYAYGLEQKRKIEGDRLEARRRQLQREIQTTQQQKDKDWTERETVLAQNQAKIAEYRQKVEAFPTELAAESQKAREAGIKEAHDAAQVRANLVAKEWEVEQQNYELQIQSREAKVAAQGEELQQLASQLETATRQAQELAIRAFGGPGRSAA